MSGYAYILPMIEKDKSFEWRTSSSKDAAHLKVVDEFKLMLIRVK